MKYQSLREEEIKNRVAKDFFGAFDCQSIVGNIDFCVLAKKSDEKIALAWGEAKSGRLSENAFLESFVQLILTIGKAKTFTRHIPPKFLLAFDAEKIAFLPYHKVMSVFAQNDSNWNVAPSNNESREFAQLFSLVEGILKSEACAFLFDENERALKEFIRANFVCNSDDFAGIQIDKNNFAAVYLDWAKAVLPKIYNVNWQDFKKEGILDADFFLADLLSEKNMSVCEKLQVLLQNDKYVLKIKVEKFGDLFKNISFDEAAHRAFWNRYERPPRAEYWDYIIDRRDLLVPQDVRERKGSFFTPQIWVKKSQEYLAAVLGENWQEEYYVWDCCAGTGNLLVGLTEKRRIFASTLDQADVDVMRERISRGANLLESHVFQFDFLNDDFDCGKLPPDLLDILCDSEKRRRLVIYINPPYAEAGSGTGKTKANVSISNATYEKYKNVMGKASNELFAQFFIRIYKEIPNCILAEFSKLKMLQSSNFNVFRYEFDARLEKLFVVPADTFDNVKGQFPIGFFVWSPSRHSDDTHSRHSDAMYSRHSERDSAKNLASKHCNDEMFRFAQHDGVNANTTHYPLTTNHYYSADVFDKDGKFLGVKKIFATIKNQNTINTWLRNFNNTNNKKIAVLMADAPDFGNQKYISLINEETNRHGLFFNITAQNLIPSCVYFAVRHCIEATWLNDRDQFLWPHDGWRRDREFQLDCIVFVLFHGQNRISAFRHSDAMYSSHSERSEESQNKTACNEMFRSAQHDGKGAQHDGKGAQHDGICANHFIPFTEDEVDANSLFRSHFMSDFLRGFLAGKAGVAEKADKGLFDADDFRHSEATSSRHSDASPSRHSDASPFRHSERDSAKNLASKHCDDEMFRSAQHDGKGAQHDGENCAQHDGKGKATHDEKFSSAAQAVFDAGRELWRYYHAQEGAVADASFYDIRERFQGRDEKGRMKNSSDDAEYTRLIGILRERQKDLASKIAQKVYEYGFLK